MRIEPFEMERMQSTWENQVAFDLSESGIQPLTLRELAEMGFDLEAALDMPLGYSQSNGTPELKERLAKLYAGTTPASFEVTNGTSEANYLIALATLAAGDGFALQVPNYMQLWGVPRSLGAMVSTFRLCVEDDWEIDWDGFERAVTPMTKLVYVSHPNNPTGKALESESMQRIVARCEEMDAWLIADEVYLGAEISKRRTQSFWGMGDKVIVTSGLSKAYGIPGIRVGWIVGPESFVERTWAQHDYITIGPNKLSDLMARTAVEPANREKLYARTRQRLQHNLPIMREWVDGFGGKLTFNDPDAGAIALMKYDADIGSVELCERVRVNRDVLIVPGAHLGLEGFVRMWMGGEAEFMKEGLARVGKEFRQVF